MSDYSLWLKPTGEVADRLQEQINDLSIEHQTPEFPPHVTLLGSLQPPESELVKRTDKLASTTQSLQLVLTEADYLNRFYQSLFIQVKKSANLKEVHDAACSVFGVSHNDYMPHLSLLYGEISDEEKELTLDTVGREFHLELPVNELVLMQTHGQPDQWKEIHSVALQ